MTGSANLTRKTLHSWFRTERRGERRAISTNRFLAIQCCKVPGKQGSARARIVVEGVLQRQRGGTELLQLAGAPLPLKPAAKGGNRAALVFRGGTAEECCEDFRRWLHNSLSERLASRNRTHLALPPSSIARHASALPTETAYPVSATQAVAIGTNERGSLAVVPFRAS